MTANQTTTKNNPQKAKQEIIIIKQQTHLFPHHDRPQKLYSSQIATDITWDQMKVSLGRSHEEYRSKAKIYSKLYSIEVMFKKFQYKHWNIPVYHLFKNAGLFLNDHTPDELMLLNELAVLLKFPKELRRKPIYQITSKGFYFLDHILNSLKHDILATIYR
jgi:hypothetical protein